MQIGGREYSVLLQERIKEAIKNKPDISRTKLSREICRWMDWRSINGKLQEVSCRKALLELERGKIIELPVQQGEYSFQKKTNRKRDFKGAKGQYRIKELGEIEIKPIKSRYSKESKLWNEMMEKYHYLGKGPLCGAQMRYIIKSEELGYIGAISFSSSTMSIKSRDEWIGWSVRARRKNLHLLICNSRFLILPELKVKNLASYVIGRTLQRVRTDWEKQYGYSPVLVESFVDGEYFNGSSYKAANWVYAGQTTGRRDKEKESKSTGGRKDIYLYTLENQWKSILCKEPENRLDIAGKIEKLIQAKDWIEEEFCGVEIYDKRLERRLYKVTRDFYQQPGQMIPQSCSGSKAKIKATYRFLGNKEINMEKLLKAHLESTIERVKEKEEVVLAVQDTTTLEYTSQPDIEGIGPISTMHSKKIGLILHDTIGFSVTGKPLGVLDVQCWARKEEERGKRYKRKSLPIEEKESIKWLKSYRKVKEISQYCPGKKFISIGDREADLYELFYEAKKEENLPDIIIRSCRNRKRKTEGEEFWNRMLREEIAGYVNKNISRKGSRSARIAKLSIRYAKIELEPPVGKDLPKLTLWAVYAKEVETIVTEPLEWMLLTTVELKNFNDASQILFWYEKRWCIEQYHKTLKTGTRIEDRQLEDADKIRTCLAIDMVIAWRIYYLTTHGREEPILPCTVVYSESEWKGVYYFLKRTKPPDQVPSLKEITTLVANLGGYMGRNSDGPPGIIVLWRGLVRLRDISATYSLIMESFKTGP